MRTTAAKRDTNEPAIIQALKVIGATVQPLSSRGVPDLLVGYRGQNYLLEIKTAKNGLTDDQKPWHEWWFGQVAIVHTIEEAYRAIGAEVSQ